jgi:putative ABC transport system permease protein
LRGDAKTALNANDKIVLTESAANKYFGSTDAIGKTLRVGDNKDYIVSAIAKAVPSNSQLQFDFVMNFNGLEVAKTEQWWTANYITYFLLRDKEQFTAFQQQAASFMNTELVRKEARLEGSNYLKYHFEPLTKVHLYSSLDGFEPNGNIVYVYVLGLIALLILIIACVNYTNLAIAQSVNRSSEIGVRKVMGAMRRQLFTQFIGESMLVTFIALLLAVFISVQLLPLLNDITGKHLVISDLLYAKPLLILLGSGIIISFIAGAYPALVLSGTVIISILRSGFSFSSKGTGLRKSLIVVQFVISVFLISTTVIIMQQMSYIRNKDLGYSKDHVIILPIDFQVINKYDLIKESVKRAPRRKKCERRIWDTYLHTMGRWHYRKQWNGTGEYFCKSHSCGPGFY